MTGHRKPSEHGTNTGYTRHVQSGDVALWQAGHLARCRPCTDAHAAYMRENRAIRRRLGTQVA